MKYSSVKKSLGEQYRLRCRKTGTRPDSLLNASFDLFLVFYMVIDEFAREGD
jgi:hypothetical protein